ncbi:unnamed protein product, partial [Scytosiphon promiscuus]
IRYEKVVVRQDEDGPGGPVAALGLGRAIENTFLAEGSSREVNIGHGMRLACLARRARDEKLARASLDTFTPIVLELLSLMAHTSLREFRASAHYATIEACLQMGPRDVRNSGATSEMTY